MLIVGIWDGWQIVFFPVKFRYASVYYDAVIWNINYGITVFELSITNYLSEYVITIACTSSSDGNEKQKEVIFL